MRVELPILMPWSLADPPQPGERIRFHFLDGSQPILLEFVAVVPRATDGRVDTLMRFDIDAQVGDADYAAQLDSQALSKLSFA